MSTGRIFPSFPLGGGGERSLCYMIRGQAGFIAVPHFVEQVLEVLGISLGIEQRRSQSGCLYTRLQ